MKKRVKNIIIAIIICIILAGWIALFNYISPQELVAKLGARNGYLILFLLGILGGASTFTGPSYFLALTTLSVAGLNPLFLALAGGIGVTIGDSIILILGINAGKKFPGEFKEKVDKLKSFLEKKPEKMIPFLVYLYIGLTPFPNEFVTIPLGLTGYKLRKIIPIILLGNLTSGMIFALTGIYGINYFPKFLSR
ncbi:MAG: hypothetical protein ABIJ14_01355 [Nanoarchaeota archaeon]|nr:hypothetical protein [Nanoarchaeota archaeon]